MPQKKHRDLRLRLIWALGVRNHEYIMFVDIWHLDGGNSFGSELMLELEYIHYYYNIVNVWEFDDGSIDNGEVDREPVWLEYKYIRRYLIIDP